jgi:hypothetical protein
MDADGNLLPLREEQALEQARLAGRTADTALLRADAEKQRADEAWAELALLRAQLDQSPSF